MQLKKILVNFFYKTNETELKPYTEKQRSLCPFYGFSKIFNLFNDYKNNQCGFKDLYELCQMESLGESPNWNECACNTKDFKKNLKKNYNNVAVYPNEFRFPNSMNGHGIPFSDWMKYILEKKPIKIKCKN